MQINIMSQINPVFECTDILDRFYSRHSYIQLKKEVINRLEIRFPEIENLLDFLQDVSSEVTQSLSPDDPIASYLFSPLGDQPSTLADAFLYFYGDFSETDLHKIESGVLTSFRQSPLSFLVSTLDNFNLLNLSASSKKLSECSLFDLMKICTLSDKDKWHLLTFYHDFENYFSHFITILSATIDAFLPYIDSFSPWTDSFFQEFLCKVNEETLGQYMADNFQVILPDTNNILVQPSLFDCSHLKYLSADTPGKLSNMLWGIHFETIFSNQMKQNSASYICDHLKLLSDRSKFDILRLLSKRSYYSSELAKALNLSTSTIAHHMQALQNAHFVTVDTRSTYRTYYKLNTEYLNRFLGQVHQQLLSD